MSSTTTSRVILLNALVPITDGCVCTKRVDIEVTRTIINSAQSIVSYVGHDATVSLINRLFGLNLTTNRGMYNPQYGDIALIFRLKRRLEKPEDVQNVSLSDIEILLAQYMPKCQ